MAHGKWAGLITNASPYVIPPGAAVEQTNLTTIVPGQLTTRGGMRPVTTTPSAPETRDFYPYVTSTSVTLLALNSSGEIVALATPAYGTATGAPVIVSLTPFAGQVQSNYTGGFYDYEQESP
jgi:hypothetical protein